MQKKRDDQVDIDAIDAIDVADAIAIGAMARGLTKKDDQVETHARTHACYSAIDTISAIDEIDAIGATARGRGRGGVEEILGDSGTESRERERWGRLLQRERQSQGYRERQRDR